LREHLEAAGVDVNFVGEDMTVSSGVASISIDHAGQNSIVIVPGANGTFGVEQLIESRELIASAAIVLLQLEIPIETVYEAARLAKEAGALVILDPAPAVEIPNDLLALVDYLTPNETELATLVGMPLEVEFDERSIAARARELRARGARKVIVKLGVRGALLVTQDEEQLWPALKVATVDTTAAGDWFNAALAVALAAGEAETKAGMFATAAAACAVMRKGAQPGELTRAEVEELLKRQQSTSC
jgi:ribokinase